MNKVLVTGQMRSGTTFIANFLNSQKNVTIYADFLRSLFLHGKNLRISKINAKLTELEKNILLSNAKAEFMAFNIDGIDSIKKPDFDTWDELMQLCLDLIAGYSNDSITNVVGVKKTAESFYISELLEKNYKIIYIYRDPRDVFLSAKNRFSHYSLFNSLNNWKKDIDNILKYEHHKNLLLIKFEDLISKKEASSTLLSNFLGTKINPDLESLTIRKSKNYNDNSAFHDVKKLFDSSALFRWKKYLDSDEVLLTSIILEDYLNLFEYEPFVPSKKKYQKVVFAFKRKNLKIKLINTLKKKTKKIIKIWRNRQKEV